jgi:hypothetical protein
MFQVATGSPAIEWSAGNSQRVLRFNGWQICKACLSPHFPYEGRGFNGLICYNNAASAAAGTSSYLSAWCTNEKTYELARSKARCQHQLLTKFKLTPKETVQDCANAVASAHQTSVMFEFGQGPRCTIEQSVKKCACTAVVSTYTRVFEPATCSFGILQSATGGPGGGKSWGGFWPDDEVNTYSLFPKQQWSAQTYSDTTNRKAEEAMCNTARPPFIVRAGKCRTWIESTGKTCVVASKYPTSAQQAAGYNRADHAYPSNEGCTIEINVKKFKAEDLDFQSPAKLIVQGSTTEVSNGVNTFTKYTGPPTAGFTHWFDRGMIRWLPGANPGFNKGFKLCTPLYYE